MNIMELLGSKRAALSLFAVFSLIWLLPVFGNLGSLGSYDWDQHLFYHGSAFISLTKFGEFPLWNPFYCGGSPLLANPQSVFISPFFIFVLLFGVVEGLKIEILAYMVIGLFGMFMLSRRLGIKIVQSYFAAVVFMLGSWFSARVFVGHTTFFPFALVPWAVFFYLKSLEKLYYAMLSALVLSVMFLSGGIYPFYYSALFLGLYALLEAFQKPDRGNAQDAEQDIWSRLKPLLIVCLILAFAALFSAVKLIPVIEYTNGASYEDSQYNSPVLLWNGLLSRNQGVAFNDGLSGHNSITDAGKFEEAMLSGRVPWGWHEYSSYLGIIPLLLGLAALLNYRKNWKLLVIAVIFLFLSLGAFSPVPLWSLLSSIPFLGNLHGPSRFLIMFAFCISLLSAKALSDIRNINSRHVAAAVLLIVLVDLSLVSRPAIESAFREPPLGINTLDYMDYVHVFSSDKYSTQYPYMLQNLDTVNCYERLHPKIRVVPQVFDTGDEYPGFVGNAFIAETNKSLNISYFSPNRVVIGTGGLSGTLVYNQNFYLGWHAKGKEAISYRGLMAARVSGSDTEVEFYYAPQSFYLGLAVSVISLLLAAGFALKWRQ